MTRSFLAAVLIATIGSAGGACGEEFGIHTGMCDASAVAHIGETEYVVASDEDNTLRVYGPDGGGPVRRIDLYPFLGLVAGADDSEADLEGVARVGDLIYWIGSNGRSRKGKARPQRAVLFATRVAGGGEPTLQTVGSVYRSLPYELSNNEALVSLGLERAIRIDDKKEASLAPKKRGLNIESLAPTLSGDGLFIGLRNPLFEKKAILLSLENPKDVVLDGAEPGFGPPVLLDLGGDGIRGMAWDSRRKRYTLLAGPANAGDVKLWTWAGPGQAPEFLQTFSDIVPEGIALRGGEALLVSDDGNSIIGGQRCKKLSDDAQKQFRTLRTQPQH